MYICKSEPIHLANELALCNFVVCVYVCVFILYLYLLVVFIFEQWAHFFLHSLHIVRYRNRLSNKPANVQLFNWPWKYLSVWWVEGNLWMEQYKNERKRERKKEELIGEWVGGERERKSEIAKASEPKAKQSKRNDTIS